MKGEGEYVRGKIPTHVLVDQLSAGHNVAIVSPSPFFPDGFDRCVFATWGSNDMRWKNIEEAMTFNNVLDKDDVIYVDDLEANRNQLRAWGVKQVFSPEEFLEKVK